MKKIAIILLSVVFITFAFSKDFSNTLEFGSLEKKFDDFVETVETVAKDKKEEVSTKIEDGTYSQIVNNAVENVKEFTKNLPSNLENVLNTIEPKKAHDINEILSVETVSELKRNGSIKRFVYGEDDVGLKLFPDTKSGNEIANYWQRENEPVFLVESLYLIDKNSADKNDSINKIAKVLTNLSEMEGIQYYSSSQEKMDTLYTDVYTVNNPIDKVEIDDPIESDIDGLVSYVYQKDRSLSGTVYKFDYFKNDCEVGFRGINTEKIRYKIMNITVVHPENLVLTLNATDVGDQILFYLLVQADVPKIPFVSKKLATSFSNRAEAIFEWCVDMYREE